MKHKDHYNDQYILDLSEKLTQAVPDFNKETFSNSLIGKLEDKELFARFDFIVDALETNLGSDYRENLQAFYQILGPELEQSSGSLALVGGCGHSVVTWNDMEMKIGKLLWPF